jgi:hypothetical protein
MGDRVEAAVTAARIAANEGATSGAVFAPLAMGGAKGLGAGGPAADRLARWLDGMKTACLSAMRHLDDIQAWSARAETMMAPLSGKTPSALRAVLTEWPIVSAPMAEALTGASRAAVLRKLALMQAAGPDPKGDRERAVSDVECHKRRTAAIGAAVNKSSSIAPTDLNRQTSWGEDFPGSREKTPA